MIIWTRDNKEIVNILDFDTARDLLLGDGGLHGIR